MTANEVVEAEKSKSFYVISVWEHKTVSSYGSARIALNVRVYQLLLVYMGSKKGPDLVFTTSTGERVTHISLELEKLSEYFSKKFSITPTYNRKQIATAVARTGSDADVRSTAQHMTHSLEVHRASYQQTGDATSAVDRYLNLHESSI